jgi:glycosyltransferase involved in cell wall biosynthesis
MKKYLFIMTQEGHRWGGSEPLWSSAAEHLARWGNEVRVSVKDWGTPVPQIEHLASVGCRILYRSYAYRMPSFIHRQINKIFPPPPAPPYRESHMRAAGSDVDLVVVSHTHNGDGLEWMEAARVVGRKYAAIAQSAVVYWWPDDDRAERLAESYKNSAAAYFVSQAILDISRRQFGTPLPNARVVRNPFNVRYDASPPWPADPDEGLALACVGRLDVTSKGQDVLLQVLALPHWGERRIRVSLVGNGPNERGLRRIAAQLGLTSVDFCGHSDNVEDVWAKHHALVLPSRFEGMPLVVVEAMLCGRPCIATDVGGNSELIRDGINGFLAKAATIELFDEAMNRAWENRHRLKEIGVKAATDVRQWVSRDPGEDLARELTALVNGSTPAIETSLREEPQDSIELNQ